MSPKQTWFITGSSSGFGERLVLSLLARGDTVIATARNPSSITHLADAGATTLALDVTAPATTLAAVVAHALTLHGNIDVLVNNAGYIQLGTLEDVSPEQWSAQYATNVFGAVNVTRALLPHFRARRAGVVVWMGSVGGWKGLAACGAYCSTKFAVQGIAEAFAAEVRGTGIQSVLVEPGYFRTAMLKAGNVKMEGTKFAEYEGVVKQMYGFLEGYNGKQPGDPEKGVQRIIEVVKGEGMAEGRVMPERLLLGSDGVEIVRKEIEESLQLLGEWEDVSRSTDFEAAA